MVPVLFHVGTWGVPTHDAFIVLGAFVATAVFAAECRRRGEWHPAHAWVAVAALVSGAVVAKGATAWQWALTTDDLSWMGLLAHGGKSVLGGLAGAYGGALLAKRVLGIRHSTGDLFAPAVAAGMAVGRVGCFLTEPVGTPTTLPWAVHLSPAQAAAMPSCPHCATTGMHPSLLYEVAFHVAALVVLRATRDRVRLRGSSFTFYLLGYGIFRFLMEFVRGSPTFWWGLTGSQWFLLVTVPLLAATVVRHARAGLYRPPTRALQAA